MKTSASTFFSITVSLQASIEPSPGTFTTGLYPLPGRIIQLPSGNPLPGVLIVVDPSIPSPLESMLDIPVPLPCCPLPASSLLPRGNNDAVIVQPGHARPWSLGPGRNQGIAKGLPGRQCTGLRFRGPAASGKVLFFLSRSRRTDRGSTCRHGNGRHQRARRTSNVGTGFPDAQVRFHATGG